MASGPGDDVVASHAAMAWFLDIGGGGSHRQATSVPTPEQLLANASAAKAAGNADFGEKRYHRAECSYTEAISLLDVMATVYRVEIVPKPIVLAATELEVVCLSNRAQCYLKLGMPGEAVDDCHRALAERFDGVLMAKLPLQKKLLTRKARAHRDLDDAESVVATIEIAEQLGFSGDEFADGLRDEPMIPLQHPTATLKIDSVVQTMIAGFSAGKPFTAELAKSELPAEVLNARDSGGNSCLDVAAVMLASPFATHAAAAIKLLAGELGAEVNHKVEHGKTPLMFAAAAPPACADAVVALLDAGADVSAVDDAGYNPLMVALSVDSPSVPLLLERTPAAAVNTATAEGLTALMFAAQSGNLPVVIELLRRGASVTQRDTALGYSAYTFAKRLGLAEISAAIAKAATSSPAAQRAMAQDDVCLAWRDQVDRMIMPIVRAVEVGSIDRSTPLTAADDAKIAAMELRLVSAMFTMAGLDEVAETTRPKANPYLALFDAVMAIAPAVLSREYIKGSNMTDDERAWIQMCPGFIALENTPAEDDRQAAPKPWLVHPGEHTAQSILGFHSEFLTLIPLRVYAVFSDHFRNPLVHTFSFAIPNKPALEAIARYGPVVELGAGTGYWCKLLRDRGVDVVAYDLHPPTADLANRFFSQSHAEVLEGDEQVLAGGNHADRTLFLCWPNNDVAADDWDARCLKLYGGGTVVHVGELRGHSRVPIGAPLAQADGEGAPSGVTTSLACQLALEKGFELVETVGLPNWHFTSDRLTVWRRRSKPAVPAGR